MKKSIWLIILFVQFTIMLCWSQNVGIGVLSPAGKLHIKGTANISQLLIDGNSTQSNVNPLVKLRDNAGNSLMWIHSDHFTNIFIGQDAGRVNNTAGEGTNNVFIGSAAGYDNTTGKNNVVLGSYALFSNNVGSYNTAIGYSSLFKNNSGNFNTATGSNSLVFNTSGYENTANGANALYLNTIGNLNTASGASALSNNYTGNSNTAYGANALYTNSSGNFNTANGDRALYFNNTGNHNTAMGSEALYSNTSFANTGVGYRALFSSQGASGNTAIGYLAGDSYSNSWDNTYIGNGADANGIYNTSIALGAFTTVSANQQVRIGFNATSIGGPQNWTNTSDGRIKNNVREDVHGLDFINLLRPITYTKNLQQEMNIVGISFDRPLATDNPYETMRHSGFIAQEVEQAAQLIGYDFSGVDAPKNDKDLYGLRYAEFVVPLVKAVQELNEKIAIQDETVMLLKSQIAQLELQNKKILEMISSQK